MKKENAMKYLVNIFLAALVAAAFLCDSPRGILEGLQKIILSQNMLITDFFTVGGMGAAFLNAALVLALCEILVLAEKIPFTGPTMATLFINAGYGLWGKNPFNILPILFGVWIYTKAHHVRFGRLIYTALFGTCLAPFVTELCYLLPVHAGIRIAAAVLVGIVIGFFLPPLSMHTQSMHMGYNLFNIGFSAGILAFVFYCILKSFGIDGGTVLLWQSGRPAGIAAALYLLFAGTFVCGWWLSGWKLGGLKKIFSRPGRAVTDFVIMDGVGPTMMNMGLVGAICITYILLIGGDLSGPVIGSILMAYGFAAFGAHVKNYIPVLLGVYLFTYLSRHEPTEPGIQLAAIFGVGLSPIAGQFGFLPGILTGMVHSAVVMCTAPMYGGLNLYNNGFSAGWVAIFMVPALESFMKNFGDKRKRREARKKGRAENDSQ
ncbi:MAG: DUF1576 domain-containing protein [Roseburia sp.]|nr:DUF1576 domain-containing protein [Roseburia sp.]MCM1097448.1 DUF1576 domain-containing protein [Ruminococcus flavefaciens]